MCECVSVCTILLTSIYASIHSAPSTTLNLPLTSQKFTSLPRAPSPGSIPPTTLASNIAGIGRSKTASVPHKRLMTPVNDGYIPMLPKARPPLSTMLYPTAVPLPLNPQSPTTTNQYYSGDDLAPRTPELDLCPEVTSEQSRLQERPTFSQSQLGGTEDAAEHNLSEGLGGNVDYVNVQLGAEEDLADVEEGQQGGVEYVNIQLGSHQTQPVVSLLCTLLIT